MNIRYTFKKLAIATSVALAVWLLWPSLESAPNIAKDVQIVPTKVNTVISKSKMIDKSDPKPMTVANIATQQSAALVARAYAAELSFPPYSQPLKNTDFDRLNPNHFNPQTVPVDDDGASLTAAFTKYRYTYPEEISASLEGLNIDSATLNIIDIENKKVIISSDFEKTDDHWQVQIEGQRDFPQQLQANVVSWVNGKKITIALALKYVDSIATLESFEPPNHQNADMVITANIDSREKGLYRLRANLFDANSEPIAYLTAKNKLSKGKEQLQLKVHKSILSGRLAPFYISTFTLELMSPAPGAPKKYGTSSINQFDIDDFPVSSLDDSQYEPSTKEKQRLNLLNKIADGT